MKQPYYIIEFSAVNCFLDIRVNDASVLFMESDGQISTVIPINTAILESGRQRIAYNILPLLGESKLRDNVSFSASVFLLDAAERQIDNREEINKFILPENTTKIPLPAYKSEKLFYADVPYKLNAWQNSVPLEDVKDLRTIVYKAYQKIADLFEQNRTSEFANLISKREENIATALYLSEARKTKRANSLIDVLKDGFKVIPLSDDDIMFIYGYGKLVTLKKKDGSSALLLRNSNREELNIELMFHLEQGSNELTII